MNRLEFIGNLASEPEQRTVNTSNGQMTVCAFTVAAHNTRGKAQDTQFIRVNAWNKLGDLCMQYLHKGNKVYASGVASCHAYIGQDGQPHAQMQINAEYVEFLTPKAEASNAQQAQATPDSGAYTYNGFTEVNTELPF